MAPEGRTIGRGTRAALALAALGVTASTVYALFVSGFGRPGETPAPPASAPSALVAEPGAAGVAGPPRLTVPDAGPVTPEAVTLEVVADGLWLTYLPPGLSRTGGGPISGGAGAEGDTAVYGPRGRRLEARVERGGAATSWRTFRAAVTAGAGPRQARETVVRGRPAVVATTRGGGRMIAWLERPGLGVEVRADAPLAGELLAVAASARTPVGD
uniref:hypothetical protein n=1 Tax=Nonomuraea pusilla TaxID=46177 RepID=UPI0006E44352|nr:hypothetical protein [Nonomuraea pusilla]